MGVKVIPESEGLVYMTWEELDKANPAEILLLDAELSSDLRAGLRITMKKSNLCAATSFANEFELAMGKLVHKK
jgi:hypothetical protein